MKIADIVIVVLLGIFFGGLIWYDYIHQWLS